MQQCRRRELSICACIKIVFSFVEDISSHSCHVYHRRFVEVGCIIIIRFLMLAPCSASMRSCMRHVHSRFLSLLTTTTTTNQNKMRDNLLLLLMSRRKVFFFCVSMCTKENHPFSITSLWHSTSLSRHNCRYFVIQRIFIDSFFSRTFYFIIKLAMKEETYNFNNG